jgi:hypothetical protein
MASANAGAIIPIEILIKKNKVAPMGIILKNLLVSIEGSFTFIIAPKNINQTIL